jgi:hypothetical protein
MRMIQERQSPLPAHGEIGNGRRGSITTSTRGADYQLRRLKRDNPALAQRVIAGEITANQAAIEAGFREPMVQVPRDVDRMVERLRKLLGADDARKLAHRLLCGNAEAAPLYQSEQVQGVYGYGQ